MLASRKEISSEIQRNAPKCSTLILRSFPKVTDTDIPALIVDLFTYSYITHLSLTCQRINDTGAACLAGYTLLTALDLFDNSIGDHAISAFRQNNTLFKLETGGSGFYANVQLYRVEQLMLLNKKAKELQFIESAIVVIRGGRQSQPSLLRTLPSEILRVILLYLASGIFRKQENISRLCEFLLQTVRAAAPGSLKWSEANSKTKFFKKWDKQELLNVKSRYSNAAHEAEDKNYRTNHRTP